MGFEVVGFVPMAPAASRRSARASSPGLPRPVVPYSRRDLACADTAAAGACGPI